MQCHRRTQPVKPPNSEFFLPKRTLWDRLEERREAIHLREMEPGARSVIDDFVDDFVKKHNQGD